MVNTVGFFTTRYRPVQFVSGTVVLRQSANRDDSSAFMLLIGVVCPLSYVT